MSKDENPLLTYFERNPGRMMSKWMHYFDIYHRHFARFRNRPCTVVEIGVYHGGSLQMWREYFGAQARIVGVDINPRVTEIDTPGVEIVVGDQGDERFLQELARKLGPIDILIDDGGHTMRQQLVTLQTLYPALSSDGVILVEDTHTSYWRNFGGGLRSPGTFIEFCKLLVDELNAWHSRDSNSLSPSPFTRMTQSLHFYDSVVVIERGDHPKPVERQTGTPSFDPQRRVTEPV